MKRFADLTPQQLVRLENKIDEQALIVNKVAIERGIKIPMPEFIPPEPTKPNLDDFRGEPDLFFRLQNEFLKGNMYVRDAELAQEIFAFIKATVSSSELYTLEYQICQAESFNVAKKHVGPFELASTTTGYVEFDKEGYEKAYKDYQTNLSLYHQAEKTYGWNEQYDKLFTELKNDINWALSEFRNAKQAYTHISLIMEKAGCTFDVAVSAWKVSRTDFVPLQEWAWDMVDSDHPFSDIQ